MAVWSGLVLTTAHVVSSPLPFELKAEVEEAAGETKVVTFKRLTIVGFHPHLDLALVRVDAKELKDAKVNLKPAVISKTKGDTGQQLKGKMQKAAGTVQEAVGKATSKPRGE